MAAQNQESSIYAPPGAISARARIQTVLEGKIPDQAPISFWLHNFAREKTAEGLIEESLRLQRTFRFDFLKPQSPANSACTLWGAEVETSPDPKVFPKLVRPVLRSNADLANIIPARVGRQLADQVEVMRGVRAALGPDVPVIGTIFAPLMVLWEMHAGGKAAVLEMVREAPDALTPALDNIADVLSEFARMLIKDAGVDGIFYATTTCCRGELTEEAHARYHAPYDKQILDEACKGGWMNILHLCGHHHIEAARFVDRDVPIVSWELGQENPGIPEMHGIFGRTMLTGLPGKPVFGTAPVDSLRQQASDLLSLTGGRHLLVGPGCSINPGIDESRMAAMVEQVRAITLNPHA